MISSNYPVIMDATSTTSSYGTIEQNDPAERMYSSVNDSRDEITERELLEDPNQDPDDEDTLSDDSLRLRVSDDEADISQTGATFELAIPCCSSEQTTSQDTTMGCIDSNKKIAISTETNQSIRKSRESESNKEHQSSKKPDQTLYETYIGRKKNMNSPWKGKGRKQHFINSVHSPQRLSPRYSFYARYNFGNSNHQKSPPYFNNQDNYGKMSNNRKHGSHWKPSKGKQCHSNKRSAQGGSVKDETSNPERQSCSKSHTKPESDSVESSYLLDTAPKTNHKALPSANNESSKECSTVNPNRESTDGPKTLADFSADISDRKDCGDVSTPGYDSKFTSDSPDVRSIASDEQCTETPSSPANLDAIESSAIALKLPLENTESMASSGNENETAIDDTSSLQNSNVDSLDTGKETTESDSSVNSNVTEPISGDTNADAVCVPQEVVDVQNGVTESSEESNKVMNSLDTLKDPGSGLTPRDVELAEEHLDERPVLDHQHSAIDKNLEIKRLLNKSTDKEQADKRKDAKNKENIEEKQTNTSSLNNQEVTKEASKIVVNDNDTDDNEDGSTSNNKRKSGPNNKETELSECVPRKSKTLKNAEEVVSNNLVCSETSVKSSDNSGQNITKNSLLELDSDIESQRQHVMKRSLSDTESVTDKSTHKKMKITPDLGRRVSSEQLQSLIPTDPIADEKQTTTAQKSNETPKPLHYVRKFFQRDMKGKLTKLKREELEELIIQKLVETITMRSEIGRLREQARISERNQEATRIRCQQLSKQIKDFDMVLSRNAIDRRANNDKPVPPIKINRSVGLQVNFMTEPGIQSLKALSINNTVKTNVPNPVTVNGGNTTAVSDNTSKTAAAPRRGIKVRSPRRAEVAKSSSLPVPPLTSTVTPTAFVVSKPADTSHNLPMPINSKEQVLPNVNSVQPVAAKVQGMVINGKISNQANRHISVTNNHIAESNDLIDLTEEEDKNKPISHTTTSILPVVATVTPSIGTKVPHNRFQRVVQGPLPGNVAIATQPANIRVVQSVGQPTPTALVNNINAARLAYVMQGTAGTRGQLLITSNPNQIRPAISTTRGQFSNVAYKTGISTLANGTVRVLTTTASPISSSQQIPAPLPKTPHYQQKNGWKLSPPPPSVKISKVGQDIILSWNMAQSEDYADIASYQLYAYQEIPGAPSNPNLWKKVGDVRALPLPMACTLKEFTPGNNYYFAVRAVDVHSRLGQYSGPKNISL